MATFVPRSYESILADAVSAFVGSQTNVTDFNEGSVIRTLLETVSQEIARLYLGVLIGINQAEEESSFTTFGFDRLQPARAFGLVTLMLDTTKGVPSAVVPAGSAVSTSDGSLSFNTVADVTLSTGDPNVSVGVLAQGTGSSFNVNVGAISVINESTGAVSVSNPAPFISGSDLESDDQRRERFAPFLQGLHRATYDSILYGARTAVLVDENGFILQQVQKASTIETSPGHIAVYVHNGVAGNQSDIAAACQRVIDGYLASDGTPVEGYKAAGIIAAVSAAQEVPVDVLATIELEAGRLPAIVKSAVETNVEQYILGLDVGDVVRLETLKQVARATPGVLDIVSFTSPTGNITPAISQIARPGTIVVAVQ